jgi:membrane-bound lytic murein transglycosylase B
VRQPFLYLLVLVVIQFGTTKPAYANPDWIAEVARTAELEPAEVEEMLAGLEPSQPVLKAISSPWERKPWYQYYPIFLTEERVEKGVAFWRRHAEVLERAEKEFGVPAAVIVAILGVETTYGGGQGTHSVLVSLYTLGFHYPKRGAFFRKELGHYLRLATDEGWAMDSTLGSYAGAMGMGQFIPSSYRRYAIDFDGDGKRDLFANTEDAIGSVANYFKVHGWKTGQPVLFPAEVSSDAHAGLVSKKLELNTTVGDLRKAGVTVSADLDPAGKARLFLFDVENGTEWRVGLKNFYVITRYNHSALYARVVYELSVQIETAMSAKPE